MKNNSLLVLLAAVLGFGTICAIVAGLAMSIYNNGVPSLDSLQSRMPISADASTQTGNNLENEAPVVDEANSSFSFGDMNLLYMASLTQKYQLCQSMVSGFMISAFELEADPGLQNDSEYLEILKSDLDKIETNCAALGSEEDVPEEFAALNAELLLVNQEVTRFIGNYREWIENPQQSSLVEGNEAIYAVIDHLQQAGILLQEAITP